MLCATISNCTNLKSKTGHGSELRSAVRGNGRVKFSGRLPALSSNADLHRVEIPRSGLHLPSSVSGDRLYSLSYPPRHSESSVTVGPATLTMLFNCRLHAGTRTRCRNRGRFAVATDVRRSVSRL